jgi:hypothetical protein
MKLTVAKLMLDLRVCSFPVKLKNEKGSILIYYISSSFNKVDVILLINLLFLLNNKKNQ